MLPLYLALKGNHRFQRNGLKVTHYFFWFTGAAEPYERLLNEVRVGVFSILWRLMNLKLILALLHITELILEKKPAAGFFCRRLY
jgi:hypothetical protein